MTTSRSSKDEFFENFINPYLREVMNHSHTIDMYEGVLHIRDVQSPNKEGSEKARLTTVKQEILKFQGMVEHGLSANLSLITYPIHKNKNDNYEIVQMIFNLHDRLQDFQAQIFDL
ncbi:hypothetical protein D1007_50773 [Hordeum vulgare]|nr:hypothetical protein D1007_50773 [Hordeum vulgare]